MTLRLLLQPDMSKAARKTGDARGAVCFNAEEVIRSLGMAAEALQGKGMRLSCSWHVHLVLDTSLLRCAFRADAALRVKQGEVSALHSRNHALEEQLRQGIAEREALARRLCNVERSLRQVWAVLWDVFKMPCLQAKHCATGEGLLRQQLCDSQAPKFGSTAAPVADTESAEAQQASFSEQSYTQ